MTIRSSITATGLAIIIAAVSISSEAYAKAGKKPRPSFSADPQKIIKMLSGNTTKWKTGGAYWHKDGKFEAVWANPEGEPFVGVGKWYVTTKGSHCYEAVWYGEGESENVIKRCWEHVYDEDGTLWERSTKKEDKKKWGWYNDAQQKMSNGNTIKSDFRKYKKELGVK